jgi:hypothetical protein
LRKPEVRADLSVINEKFDKLIDEVTP